MRFIFEGIKEEGWFFRRGKEEGKKRERSGWMFFEEGMERSGWMFFFEEGVKMEMYRRGKGGFEEGDGLFFSKKG
jgi:hypothetical protein